MSGSALQWLTFVAALVAAVGSSIPVWQPVIRAPSFRQLRSLAKTLYRGGEGAAGGHATLLVA
jgi:hypothetical protein